MNSTNRRIIDVIRSHWCNRGFAIKFAQLLVHIPKKWGSRSTMYRRVQDLVSKGLIRRRDHGRGFHYYPVVHCPTCGEKLSK